MLAATRVGKHAILDHFHGTRNVCQLHLSNWLPVHQYACDILQQHMSTQRNLAAGYSKLLKFAIINYFKTTFQIIVKLVRFVELIHNYVYMHIHITHACMSFFKLWITHIIEIFINYIAFEKRAVDIYISTGFCKGSTWPDSALKAIV